MKNLLNWLRRNGATIGVAAALAATISPSMRDAATAINAGIAALATSPEQRSTLSDDTHKEVK